MEFTKRTIKTLANEDKCNYFTLCMLMREDGLLRPRALNALPDRKAHIPNAHASSQLTGSFEAMVQTCVTASFSFCCVSCVALYNSTLCMFHMKNLFTFHGAFIPNKGRESNHYDYDECVIITNVSRGVSFALLIVQIHHICICLNLQLMCK